MRLISLYILAALLFYLFPGCQRTMGKTELLSYLNNPGNKLMLMDSSADLTYKVYFKPSDLIASQYLTRYGNTINPDSLKKAHEDYLYFNLSISYMGKDLFSQRIQGTDFGDLQKRVSFALEQYISLSDELGTNYKLIESNYPRLYGMTPATNILLVFKKTKKEFADRYELIVRDFVMDTSDQLQFTFYKKDILNAPELNFDQLL